MAFGVLVLGGAAVAQLAALSVPWRYREQFQRAARAHAEDPDLLHAIAWHESGMNPGVISAPNPNGTRDYGLMQINSTNFTALGLTQTSALNADVSTRAAAQHIHGLRARARNVADVISMYNAGERRGGGPRLTPDGTYVNQSYVRSVLARYTLVRVANFAPLKREA